MMSREAITNTSPESLDDWQTPRETAPSTVRSEEPRLARWVGAMGMMLVALAGFAMFFQTFGGASRVGPGWRIFLVTLGLAGMLFHAARDPEMQIRRTYGMVGFLCLLAAALISALPFQGQPPGALFLPYGFLLLPLALLFLLAFTRHETEPAWRRLTISVVGAVGLALSASAFIGGNVTANFLTPYGFLLALIGLIYWWAYVGMQGTMTDLGYRAGLGLGIVGGLVFLVALGRSALPPLLFAWGITQHKPEESYLASAGLLLMSLGILYSAFSAGLCSDNRLIVMTRRELAAFFYSPIAYIVLFGLSFVGMCLFFLFINTIVVSAERGSPLIEPIIQYYIIDFVPVVTVIIVVPVITMRLLSEERRTGTLEVLLTAPLQESTIVLSKFLGAWIFFMILWLPLGLFLIALRLEGGIAFDWRPLLSFFIGLGCSGAGFLSMGLFFSSLTRNQIAAAVLTFMGMMVLISIFFVIRLLPSTNAWRTVLTHASFINLWISTLEGKVILRDLLFPVSATIFWLFMTVKVLEARKWS